MEKIVCGIILLFLMTATLSCFLLKLSGEDISVFARISSILEASGLKRVLALVFPQRLHSAFQLFPSSLPP